MRSNRRSGCRLVLSACLFASLLFCGYARPAFATPYGVFVSTNTNASDAQPGCGVSTSYFTPTGGSANSSTGALDCSLSETVPAPPELTTATAQSGASASADGYYTVNSSASATSDLSTASLHAVASLPQAGPSSPGATADANWFDNLTFTIAGANSNTVTNIPVTFSVDGTASAGYLNGAGTGVQSGPNETLVVQAGVRVLGQGACAPVSTNASDGCILGTGDFGGTALWTSSTQSFVNSVTINSGPTSFIGGSISWDTPVTQTATDFTVTGTLSLTGQQAAIEAAAVLSVDAGYGTLDYSNTASLSFNLPSGVTYTSDSGVFDTPSTVPEPTSLTLLAGALAGFGTIRRRRTKRGGATFDLRTTASG